MQKINHILYNLYGFYSIYRSYRGLKLSQYHFIPYPLHQEEFP